MTEKTISLVHSLLKRYEQYFISNCSRTDSLENVCHFLWNRKVYNIYQEDKLIVESIIERLIRAESIMDEEERAAQIREQKLENYKEVLYQKLKERYEHKED